ncbi:MAG: lysophospholipid acyltransferase family protein [Desulfobacterales bacterium]|nr:MAG: lysophospholipid acyltransferase family protein [Desulfobacterales bacterium]
MKINLSSFLQCRFNIYLCKTLGWSFAFFYILILGRLYFILNRRENSKIKKAIKSVFSNRKQIHSIKTITKEVFRGIFSHYYEKFFNVYSTSHTLRSFVHTHMKAEGLDAIKQGLAKGNGVLLITGHFGGVEFIPAFLGAHNIPVSIVAKFKTRKLRDVSLEQASHFSTKIIDADHTPNIIKAIYNDLRENRVVITQCDEMDEWKPYSHNRIFFLGKQVRLDKTLNILSKKCTAAIVFGVMHRSANHQYKFVATSLEEMVQKYQRSIDMPIGAVLLKYMERYIYKHPEEWYQWKKYTALDAYVPYSTVRDKPTPIPILKPLLGKIT